MGPHFFFSKGRSRDLNLRVSTIHSHPFTSEPAMGPSFSTLGPCLISGVEELELGVFRETIWDELKVRVVNSCTKLKLV